MMRIRHYPALDDRADDDVSLIAEITYERAMHPDARFVVSIDAPSAVAAVHRLADDGFLAIAVDDDSDAFVVSLPPQRDRGKK